MKNIYIPMFCLATLLAVAFPVSALSDDGMPIDWSVVTNGSGTVSFSTYGQDRMVIYVAPPTDGHTPQVPYSSWEWAATNLQQAIDFAQDDAEIIIRGTFSGTWIRNVDQPELAVIDKPLWLHSEDDNSANATIGRSNQSAAGNYAGAAPLITISNANAKVSGITFQNGYVAPIKIFSGSSMSNCVINGAWGRGTGPRPRGPASRPASAGVLPPRQARRT